MGERPSSVDEREGRESIPRIILLWTGLSRRDRRGSARAQLDGGVPGAPTRPPNAIRSTGEDGAP
jgi:hypothetical protein